MAIPNKTTRPVFTITVLVLILLGAACGGSVDSATSDPPAGSGDDGEAVDAGPEVGDDDADNDGDNSSAAGPVGAVVVIGGERFEATEEIVCVTLGGGLSADFTTADGSVDINISLPPEDWETSTDSWSPPMLRVDDNRDPDVWAQWEAGSEVFISIADAQVDSFSVDGKQASGSAMLLDIAAAMLANGAGDPEPDAQPATFEVTCT